MEEKRGKERRKGKKRGESQAGRRGEGRLRNRKGRERREEKER